MNAEQMMAMQAQEEAIAQQQAMAMKEQQNMIFQNELQKHFDTMQTPEQPNLDEMSKSQEHSRCSVLKYEPECHSRAAH